jgi:tetratricopeptide (TPR) repeat protein
MRNRRRYRGLLAAAVVAALAACGGPQEDAVSSLSEPNSSASARPPGAPPTFNRDVAPILWANCAPCHRPGQSAPFSLLTYDDARRHAARIAAVTETGYMPPWLPEPGYGSFIGERRLDEDELRTIAEWVSDGAVEGDAADLAEAPAFADGWQLGEPDLVVEMPEEYTLAPADGDLFRSFVIPTPPGPPRYVRNVEMRPGNPGVVHHAMLTVDDTSSSRELDAVDPDVGFFTGMDVGGEAYSPPGYFIGWTPGLIPKDNDYDMAWELQGGSDLVLQLHMLPGSEPQEVRSSVGLHFAPSPPVERPALLRLGSTRIDLPAGATDVSIEDSYVLPIDVRMLSIYPHAHYLGKEMKGFATLPDGSTEWLIWIRQWDFMKQDWYTYAEPVFLPAGSELKMQFTYDNSADNPSNPSNPPVHVRYGPNSADEMGDLWLQALPTDPAEAPLLTADFARKERGKQIADLRVALEADPDDPVKNYNLGVLLQFDGRSDEAMALYRTALALDPDNGDAHNNLAGLLAAAGSNREAIDHYREALRLDPAAADVYVSMGRMYLAQGFFDDAITLLSRAASLDPEMWQAHADQAAAHARKGDLDAAARSYRAAIRIEPGVAEVHVNLGEVLAAQGAVAMAEDRFRVALSLDPGDARAHYDLGRALEQQRRVGEAIEHYRRAVALDPDNEQARASLARALGGGG